MDHSGEHQVSPLTINTENQPCTDACFAKGCFIQLLVPQLNRKTYQRCVTDVLTRMNLPTMRDCRGQEVWPHRGWPRQPEWVLQRPAVADKRLSSAERVFCGICHVGRNQGFLQRRFPNNEEFLRSHPPFHVLHGYFHQRKFDVRWRQQCDVRQAAHVGTERSAYSI